MFLLNKSNNLLKRKTELTSRPSIPQYLNLLKEQDNKMKHTNIGNIHEYIHSFI